MKFEVYKNTFTVGPGKWSIGPGAQVTVKHLESAELVNPPSYRGNDKLIRIMATFDVQMDASICVMRDEHCWVCRRPPDMPNDDALMFILEHSDARRLCFPGAEALIHEDQPPAGHYPMKGWGSDGEDTLICPECNAELEQAAQQIRARKTEKYK